VNAYVNCLGSAALVLIAWLSYPAYVWTAQAKAEQAREQSYGMPLIPQPNSTMAFWVTPLRTSWQ
jgi:hypothetical protein